MTTKSTHLNKAGQRYKDFQVTRHLEIPELQCHLTELLHIPTNAQVMHISNDDPENLFCLSFQTLPEKSDGVAHILEHTVLCGSKKFPVKDPFFAMTRRSLNTFMNALTGSDFTCYPAATQVHKDFYNLLDVYLDAVFFPNLKLFSFLQEGHRLEFTTPTDPHTPLIFKGVVFNEMKGAMSSPSSRLSDAMHSNLFPDITYGINFGGDPKVIPELTFEQLITFHKKFYHPSRCLFFFYGNMPLEKHLDFIATKALEGVQKIPPLPPIPYQKRFEKKRLIEMSYPVAREEAIESKTYISFGWLTCPIIEQQEVLALSVLEIVLLDTDASPLKLALIKSGLCKLVSSHIDTDINEASWMITLRGCHSESADACENALRAILENIVKEGVPLQLVENAIHQLEIYRSEIGGDHVPFGLSLFMRSALLKQHKVNPEKGLTIHAFFDRIHGEVLADPNYFGKLIKKYLLDNTHFVRIVMNPDKDLDIKEMKEEQERLSHIRSQLSEEQVNYLIKQSIDLMGFQMQQEEESIDVLPKLTLDDVPKLSRNFILKQEKIGNIEVFHHPCFTNEIVYADLVFNLPNLPETDMHYVRLFCVLMSQVGCGGRNYIENLDYIQENTGGVGANLAFNLQAVDHHQFQPSLNIKGKALHRKTNKLFNLLYDLATSLDFTDLHRLKEVIQKHYIALESNLSQSAMRYAINLSASGLDVASKIANLWYGLDYFWKIKEIALDLNSSLVPLAEKMQELQKTLLGLENAHLVLTCDAALYDELKRHEFYGLSRLTTKPYEKWKCDYSLEKIKSQGRIISSPVAVTGLVFKTVSFIHQDAPALAVAASLIDNLTLHPLVREQGGAYGSGAVSNAISGNFYFYSHRDPNISRTLAAFEIAVNNVIKEDFDEEDLEEAKLEIFQSLDEPLAPGSRGEYAYSWYKEGKTQKIRQDFRDRLLALNRQDIIKALQEHVLPQLSQGAAVVFAGRELLEKENQILHAQGLNPLPIEAI
jgi:presequence protease